MTTADLIVLALEAARVPESAAEQDDPRVKKYAQQIRDCYSELKRESDFQTASLIARARVVGDIMIDFENYAPQAQLPE